MKIRQGFVSNSSSSSFIIALNDKEKCPHCGRSDKNIVDVLNTLDRDNNFVRWEDPTEFIDELQKELDEAIKELNSYSKMSDDTIIPSKYGSSYSVKEYKTWAQNTIDTNTTLINRINKEVDLGKKVVSIEIDYHNVLLNEMFEEQRDNGNITVLEGD